MADNVSLSGPVEMEGRPHVIWSMVREIASREKSQDRDREPRKYYLKLYRDCHSAVMGYAE